MLPVWKIVLVGACVLGASGWALVVNEVYFRTTASTYRNQWIELYNETGEPVDLRQFAIGTGAKQKPLISWREGSGVKLAGCEVNQTQLEAGAYALILDRTYSGEEPLEAPTGTIVATVADASLGESVFLRTNDVLGLYEKSGVEYRALETLPLSPTAHGYSLERIFVGRRAERKNFSHSILIRGKTTSPGRPNTIQGLCEDSPAARISLAGLAGSRLNTGCPFLAELRLETDAQRSSWPSDGECEIVSEGFLDLVPVDAGTKALREKGSLRLRVNAGRSASFYVLATSAGWTRLSVSACGLQKSIELRVEEPAGALAGNVFVNEVFFKAEKAAHWLELFCRSDVSIGKLRVDFWNADLTSCRTLFYSDVGLKTGEYAILGNSTQGFAKYFQRNQGRFRAHADFELYTEGLVVLSEEMPWGAQAMEAILYKNLTETVEAERSLERRTTSFPALSAAQWKTCSLSNGASPGEENSGEKNPGFQIQLMQNTLRFSSPNLNSGVARLDADQDGSLKTEIYQLNGRAVLPAPRVLSVEGGERLTLPLSYFAESIQKIRGNLIFQFSFSPTRGPGETKRCVLEVLD